MYPVPDAMTRLARAVDGAGFVAFHESSHRVFVWRAGPVIEVLGLPSAEVLGNWPCGEAETAESAAQVVAERVNAGY